MSRSTPAAGASPLGRLPNGWTSARLKDITTKVGSGATPKGGESNYLRARERFALIRSQNVFDRRFDAAGLAFISDEQAGELRGAEVRQGDLLLNITGDGITFARACAVPEHVLPARVNQHVSIIRADAKRCASQYLLCYLTHSAIKGYIESFNSGGSRRAITKGHIESFVVPLPPLNLQRAIGSVLGALDNKIDLNRRTNGTLESTARAMFQSWFVDFDPVRAKAEWRQPAGMDTETAALFPARMKSSQIGPVPGTWLIRELPQVISVNPSRSLSGGTSAPYLDMQNAPTNGHRPDSWAVRPFGSGVKFQNGDTLLARITPCLENGKTAYVDFLGEGEVGWGSTEYIVLRPSPPLPLEYGYYLARDEDFRAFAIQNMTGTSGRQRVPSSCFDQYLMAVPDSAVAERFGTIARSLMHKISANSEQNRTLAELRDALLPKLLSGELRIRDAEKTVEAHV